MRLLVIRHARAHSTKQFALTGVSDELRPLTVEGAERMRIAAAGLRRLIDRVDVLATSPMLRARQTAEIVAGEIDAPGMMQVDLLREDAPAEPVMAWLADVGAAETV